MTSRNSIRAGILFVIAILLDQITKYLAYVYLKPVHKVPVIRGVLDLQYLENRGAAFGMLQNRQWIFILFASIILIGCIVYSRRLPLTKNYIPLRYCLLFLGAGALGNMIDRVVHTYVIDFIYFSVINFPIFNVADIYVSISVTVMVILVLFFYKDTDQ